MLNPSRADASRDDPTIRRCIGFARRLGFDAIEIANLFAYASFDPRVLSAVGDPVGAANDRALRRALARADRVIVAWGNGATGAPFARRLEQRVARLVRLLGRRRSGCFGYTKAGHPRHPLRLPAGQPVVPWVPGRSR